VLPASSQTTRSRGMIPGADEILAGYPFVKRRWRIEQDPSDGAVRAAVEDAQSLAGSEAHAEPAALFFAFGRRPRAFPGAWRLMPALLALNQLQSLDLRLAADITELNDAGRHRRPKADLRRRARMVCRPPSRGWRLTTSTSAWSGETGQVTGALAVQPESRWQREEPAKAGSSSSVPSGTLFDMTFQVRLAAWVEVQHCSQAPDGMSVKARGGAARPAVRSARRRAVGRCGPVVAGEPGEVPDLLVTEFASCSRHGGVAGCE
jgi:hypothetical protein